MTPLAPWASNGAPNSNYVDWFDFRPTWPTFSEILNTLAWKTKFLKFWHFWPPRTQMGPKPKFCWLIWFSTNMTNVLWNFEHSSLKNKIFKILTLLPPQDSNGTPNQNFVDWSDFQLTWPTFSEIFNTLAWKTKFLKFWFIGAGAPRKGP